MVGIPVTWMVDRYQVKPLKMVIVIVLILDGSSGYVARVDWNRWFDLFKTFIYIDSRRQNQNLFLKKIWFPFHEIWDKIDKSKFDFLYLYYYI